MILLAAIPLAAFAAYLTAYVLYDLLLYAANALVPDPPSFAPRVFRRLNVIVPAHNEELYLPRLLASLTAQAYPRDRLRITVVADNCSDGTVGACKAFDVDVYERHDPARRSKGHAIGWILARLDHSTFDAIVIVDGDSQAGQGFLEALNLQLERGDSVIQCYNGVANPGQSWFTRLMNVSRTIANEIIHPGKRKLGLSSHLMGNGMCFSTDALKAHEWKAFSAGEDWEHYAKLVLSGAHVGYSRAARVYHQESVDLRQASSQRLRWSSSRFDGLRTFGWPLIAEGVRRRSVVCVDAALPFVFPNPSLGMNLTFVGFAAAAGLWWLGGSLLMIWWFAVLAIVQVMMFLVGALYTRNRLASAASLVVAPLFLVWKMGIDILSFFGRATPEFKRTERRAS